MSSSSSPIIIDAVVVVVVQVHELKLQERGIITSQDYTHILGRRASPLTNGIATAVYLSNVDATPRASNPDWVPFS